MKCPNCHSHLEKNTNFCPYCGVNISEIKKENRTKRNKKIIKWLLIILIPVAIIFTVFLYLNNQNTKYKAAIDNGVEAISDKNYDKAIIYFELALDEKKDDEMAEKLYENTVVLQDAENFYINEEFDQSLEEINTLLDNKNNKKEFKALFENAHELKKKIESIYEDQAEFEKDYEKATNIFERSNVNENEIEDALVILKKILSHEEINESYHQEIKEDIENLVYDIEVYQEDQIELQAIEKEEKENSDSSEYSTEETDEELSEYSTKEIDEELNEYSAEEIEYARIVLMLGEPTGSIIYVHEKPAGTPVYESTDADENIKYPDRTITLTGEFAPDGIIIYSPLGEGYINVYPVTYHWNAEGLSIEEIQELTQEILDNVEKAYIDPGDDYELLEKLRSTEFIY